MVDHGDVRLQTQAAELRRNLLRVASPLEVRGQRAAGPYTFFSFLSFIIVIFRLKQKKSCFPVSEYEREQVLQRRTAAA